MSHSGQVGSSKISVVLLLIGLGLLGFALSETILIKILSPAEKLQSLWANDLVELKKLKKLPPEWLDISEISLKTGSEDAKSLLKDLISPIPLNSKGKYKLDILILFWEEENVSGSVIQHSLIEKSSGNLLWELGRTYVLKGDPDLTKLNQIEIKQNPKSK